MSDDSKIPQTSTEPARYTPLLTWSAPEFATFQKGKWWYIILGIVIVALIVISLLFKSVLGGILFLLIGLLLVLFSVRKPLVHTITLTPSGIGIDEEFYLFSELKSFWIFYESDFQELSLSTNRQILSTVRVQLSEIDPLEVRDIILQHVPEIEQEESLFDLLARRLKI